MREQAELAEVRYCAARHSLGRMVDRLNAKRLADVPRLKELRQELLEDSLAFYQAILQQANNPNPAVRLDSAFAYLQTGEIQHAMGQPGPADENFHGRWPCWRLPDDFRLRPTSQARGPPATTTSPISCW